MEKHKNRFICHYPTEMMTILVYFLPTHVHTELGIIPCVQFGIFPLTLFLKKTLFI